MTLIQPSSSLDFSATTIKTSSASAESDVTPRPSATRNAQNYAGMYEAPMLNALKDLAIANAAFIGAALQYKNEGSGMTSNELDQALLNYLIKNSEYKDLKSRVDAFEGTISKQDETLSEIASNM